MTVVRLGAWCDFVTETSIESSQGRWAGPPEPPSPSVPRRVQADSVENLVEDFKRGVSFVVHEFADLADGRRIALHEDRGSPLALSGTI